MSDKLHVGIFGPGLSGKTTLARYISRKTYALHKTRSIVLDPFAADWGPHATLYNPHNGETEAWLKDIWASEYCLVFADEGTETIARKKEFIPLFTQIRHKHHRMVVIGHRGARTLLPDMRDQISELFLFRQTPKSAEVWVEQFCDTRLADTVNLKQYEFFHATLWGNVIKHTLTEHERKL